MILRERIKNAVLSDVQDSLHENFKAAAVPYKCYDMQLATALELVVKLIVNDVLGQGAK